MAKRLSKEQILLIPDLVREKSISEIAEGFGCHPRTIDNHIKRLRSANIEVIVKKGPRPINLTNATSKTEDQSG